MPSKKVMKGIIIYFDCYEAMRLLTDEEKGKMFSAMMDYALTGEVPPFEDRLMVSIWTLVRPKLDWAMERYDEKCERNRKSANLRWWLKYCEKTGQNPKDDEARKAWEEREDEDMQTDAYAYERMQTHASACERIQNNNKNNNRNKNNNNTKNNNIKRKQPPDDGGLIGSLPEPEKPTLEELERRKQAGLAKLAAAIERGKAQRPV